MAGRVAEFEVLGPWSLETSRRFWEASPRRRWQAGDTLARFELDPPGRKSEYLRAVAEAALDGLLDGAALRALDPGQAVQRVQQVKGLGPFAAELVVVRGANAPDALPRHERRLDAEIAEWYGPGRTLAEVSEAWRPYRIWAAVQLRALRDATSGRRYWIMMARTGPGNGQSTHAASGWPAAGTVTAYAAAILAFAYALVSLYWALGGHALVSTVGGYVEQFARRGGALPVLIALAATLAKVAGGMLALALVRPWGRVIPRRWLLAGSAGASALLAVYGGLNVLLGALVLSGVIHPAGSVDRTALRWHVGVWDLWFLVWGILLALATVGYWRRTATGPPRDGGSEPSQQLPSCG